MDLRSQTAVDLPMVRSEEERETIMDALRALTRGDSQQLHVCTRVVARVVLFPLRRAPPELSAPAVCWRLFRDFVLCCHYVIGGKTIRITR